MDKQRVILYIEDQPLETRVKMLETDGYKVISAKDGTEALNCLKRERVDLILLDIMMPPGDELNSEDVRGGFSSGVVFTKKIKEKEEWRSIPIIVITANPDRDIERELTELGVSKYFKKPVSQSELEEAIKEWLEVEPHA
jgi:CheY-like chemotaxis protein